MNVTLYYEDGSEGTFSADQVDVHGDIAYVDGILQTDIESVQVTPDA